MLKWICTTPTDCRVPSSWSSTDWQIIIKQIMTKGAWPVKAHCKWYVRHDYDKQTQAQQSPTTMPHPASDACPPSRLLYPQKLPAPQIHLPDLHCYSREVIILLDPYVFCTWSPWEQHFLSHDCCLLASESDPSLCLVDSRVVS